MPACRRKVQGLQNMACLDIGTRRDVQPQLDGLVALPRGKLRARL
jgi:hypothetical protein